MDFVLLWPGQSSLPLSLAMHMYSNGTPAITKREVNPDPPQQASSPWWSHLPCSSLFLFSLISLLLRKFPVFVQAVYRESVWDPLWAMSSRLSWLPDLLQHPVYDPCHLRRLLRRGAGAPLPPQSLVHLLPQDVHLSTSCSWAQAPTWLCILGGGGCPAGHLGGSEIFPTSQGCCETFKGLRMKGPWTLCRKGGVNAKCALWPGEMGLSSQAGALWAVLGSPCHPAAPSTLRPAWGALRCWTERYQANPCYTRLNKLLNVKDSGPCF